jgi:hypothetical protein
MYLNNNQHNTGVCNRHREEGLHSPNRFSLGAEAAGLPAAAAAPATAAAGGPIPDPRNRHSGSNVSTLGYGLKVTVVVAGGFDVCCRRLQLS